MTVAIFGIGTLLLWLSVSLARHYEAQFANGQTATGTVVELRETSSARDRRRNRSPTWKPVVRFTPRDGAAVTFEGTVSSNPPAYAIGESVPVVYNGSDPKKAMIQNFSERWLGSIITGGIGLVGAWLFRSDWRWHRLRTDGQPVSARVLRIAGDDGRWRVHAEWTSPKTGRPFQGRSHAVSVDPQPQLGETVTVRVDPNSDRRYRFDLDAIEVAAAQAVRTTLRNPADDLPKSA